MERRHLVGNERSPRTRKLFLERWRFRASWKLAFPVKSVCVKREIVFANARAFVAGKMPALHDRRAPFDERPSSE